MHRLVLSFSVAAIASSAITASALGQERPYTPRLTCGAAAGLVAARGSVVLGTGPQTYERVVADARFCSIEETTAPAWERTADNPQCFVGYRCKDKFNEGRDRD